MKILAPDFIAENLERIKPDFLSSLGVTNILLDIDNTIVPRDKTELPQESIRWLDKMKAHGFKIYLISNSMNKRALKIASEAGCAGLVAPAFKPFVRKVKKFLIKNGIEIEKSVFIGDQVFTDLLLSRRLGVKSILLKPISKSDLPHTKLLRLFEAFLLKCWIEDKVRILGEEE